MTLSGKGCDSKRESTGVKENSKQSKGCGEMTLSGKGCDSKRESTGVKENVLGLCRL